MTREDEIKVLQERLYKECYTGHQTPEWWRALAEWVYNYSEDNMANLSKTAHTA